MPASSRESSWREPLLLFVLVCVGGWAYLRTRPAPMAKSQPAAETETPMPALVLPGLSPRGVTASPPPVVGDLPAPSAVCPLDEGGGPSLPPRGFVSSSWHEGASGYEDAEREQSRGKAAMIVYFFTAWCQYCRKFEQEILADSDVDRYLRSELIKVRINP